MKTFNQRVMWNTVYENSGIDSKYINQCKNVGIQNVWKVNSFFFFEFIQLYISYTRKF